MTERTITQFLHERGQIISEGHSGQVPQQLLDLSQIIKEHSRSYPTVSMMEIGFNAGHSAELFLRDHDNLMLTSFDIGSHSYVQVAKEYIDKTFPNRHTLILGDSQISIPTYTKQHPETTFDIIFIDGGHEYSIVMADLDNSSRLAHSSTLVIMDDTIYTEGWEESYTVGPTKAWKEYCQDHKIVELGRKDYSKGRGMSWGTFVK